jgi:urease subunit alpha
MAIKLSRAEYGDIFGPTEGDKLHLADTDLIIEIEHDYNKGQYGEEALSGGGKTVRDGMAQMPGVTSAGGALDIAFTNVIVMDPVLGIVKGDIGVRDGKIVGIGKAGNPDIMDITPGLIIGAGTEVVSLEGGMIATAGGIDVHVHFESPDQAWEALSNGITTMLGGGTGSKTLGIECPGAWHLHSMIEAHEQIPVNAGFLGRGNSSLPEVIREQALNGAIGMKIHEDYGATPQVIRTCLDVADEFDFQVQIHADTLNECGFVETTIAAIDGRTMHAYHTEGAGGGHAPDIMRVCGEPNILPSSTNPTNPFTINTIAEHLDMIMAAHHLNPKLPEDVAFADSRIRGETIAAEDILHDMGAISMLSSDSQGMGRVGESVLRTWQLASKMKQQRGPLPEDRQGNDNERVLRYLAKYTINPAITFGIKDYVGSLEPGKMADIVIWDPKFFGAKPAMVYKSGAIVYSPTGDVNASIEWSQPMIYRRQYATYGNNVNRYCKIFVTQAAIDSGLGEKLPYSAQKLVPVHGTRNLRKSDMVRNNYCPNIAIDPETYKVLIDGVHISCEPLAEVPLGQRYFFR